MELKKLSSLYFDVDDTIYDQLTPFVKAFQVAFPEISVQKKEELYQLFRRKSDEVFPIFQKKLISESEMWITRMSNTLTAINVQNISSYQILNFQQKYNFYLQRIQPYPEIINLIERCQNNDIHVGIITNGTIVHQSSKIQQLGLTTLVKQGDIFISEQMQVAKPSPEIFISVMHKFDEIPAQSYYIGDNFLNDVIAPKQSGMHAIWFNIRNRPQPNLKVRPDLEITDLKNLSQVWNLISN